MQVLDDEGNSEKSRQSLWLERLVKLVGILWER